MAGHDCETNGTSPNPSGGHTGEHHRIVIVGAGFAGLGLARQLRRAGHSDVVILERAGDVGGTWRDNTYPGVQCDVPAELYSYSFARNPGWTRSYADGAEIEAYLQDCASRFALWGVIRLNTEMVHARWSPDDGLWHLETRRTTDGATAQLTAAVVVVATGSLSEPLVPDLPGADTFTGEMFHSAEWPGDLDLSGRRVAVVGTGASAVQFIPAIARDVGHLTVFQRTPPWIVPRHNPAIGPATRRRYRRFGFLQRLRRARTFWTRELLGAALTRHPRWLRRGEQLARRHLAAQVPDERLRADLTPDYALGCKRVLLSDDFYPALGRDNVEVVTDRITSLVGDGVVTADGRHHGVDTVIWGTGFAVTDHPVAHRVAGRHGATLAAHWAAGGMRAHRGTTVPGFPNLFLVTGPNTGVGHTSMVFMMEAQYRYVLGALAELDKLRLRGVAALEVTAGAEESDHDYLAERLTTTVWATGGCTSWYLDDQGRNTTLWPGSAWSFRRRLARFDASNYNAVRPDATPGPPGVSAPQRGQVRTRTS